MNKLINNFIIKWETFYQNQIKQNTQNKEKTNLYIYFNIISQLRYAASGMQGWRMRMEDSHIAAINKGKQNELHIFGVFDGHGGKEVSQYVKAHFTEEFVKNKHYLLDDIGTALIETFLRMDELMVTPEGKEELKNYSQLSKEEDDKQEKELEKTQGKKKNQYENLTKLLGAGKQPEENNVTDIVMNVGCTACVCVIDQLNHKLYFANAGDSRVVLCKKGQGFPMSIDHKPDLDHEKNRIYNAQGWVSEGRIQCNLNLSRSLGDLEYKQNTTMKPKDQMITAYPDLVCENYSGEDCDYIILGCDGIWDCINNQAICDYVSDKIELKCSLTDIINELMDNLLSEDINSEAGIGCDNMTCLIVQFKK